MSSPSSPPSSRRPAGVPESGNAKYAIVAVLLLAGTVGIYFWRNASNKGRAGPHPVGHGRPVRRAGEYEACQRGGQTTSRCRLRPTRRSPKPRRRRRWCTCRPAAAAKPSATARRPPSSNRPCRFAGRRRAAAYNQALAQDSSLKGHVVIGVKIGSSGNLCSANVVSNDMGSAAVAACAANIFRANSAYPSPRGGCVEASVPLSFVPQGQ